MGNDANHSIKRTEAISSSTKPTFLSEEDLYLKLISQRTSETHSGSLQQASYYAHSGSLQNVSLEGLIHPAQDISPEGPARPAPIPPMETLPKRVPREYQRDDYNFVRNSLIIAIAITFISCIIVIISWLLFVYQSKPSYDSINPWIWLIFLTVICTLVTSNFAIVKDHWRRKKLS